MGQKINPIGLRIGINQKWRSRWFSDDRHLGLFLKEDLLIRKIIYKELIKTIISEIEIERSNNNINIFLWTSRIGLILGQKNKNIDNVILKIKRYLKRRDYIIKINVFEVKNPDLNAQLVANNIAYRITNRDNYRVLQKQAIKNAIRLGAKGVKVTIGGRLNGADIARKEHASEGKIPFSTLRNHIDYGFCEAKTTYGQIGVKVWINHGTDSDSQKNYHEFQNNNWGNKNVNS